MNDLQTCSSLQPHCLKQIRSLLKAELILNFNIYVSFGIVDFNFYTSFRSITKVVL